MIKLAPREGKKKEERRKGTKKEAILAVHIKQV